MGWSWHYVKLSDKSPRILQTFPVPKAYQPPWSHIHYSINCSEFIPMCIGITTHSSIPAQLFSIGFIVIVRSLHNLTSLLWLHNVGNFVFERVDFQSHCNKLLYQNRKENSCLFLFNVAEQIVPMKSRDQSLFFLLYSLAYSSFPYTGEILTWHC